MGFAGKPSTWKAKQEAQKFKVCFSYNSDFSAGLSYIGHYLLKKKRKTIPAPFCNVSKNLL